MARWQGQLQQYVPTAMLGHFAGRVTTPVQEVPIPEGNGPVYEVEGASETEAQDALLAAWVDDGAPPLGLTELNNRGARFKPVVTVIMAI